MSVAARALLAAALVLAPVQASAQDFGGLLRRSVEAAGARVIGQAIDGAVNSVTNRPDGDQPAQRGRERAAPEAQASDPTLDRLNDDERYAECQRRVPVDADGGRSYEKQVAFSRCMGPRWGEGG